MFRQVEILYFSNERKLLYGYYKHKSYTGGKTLKKKNN